MKKLGIIAMAFALLLGMSQCKKEKTDTTANEGVKVSITLNVNGNGSRVAVNTENGVVTFENDDLLYVASNGVFVGTLSYDGTNFSGDIIEPTDGQKLQFYFLGNVTPAETMTEGSTMGCSVVISDQTEHLPVISYAPSRENYQIGKTDYNATLLNKCALVKFDVTTASEAATCILGMNNKVTMDFTDNSFDYSQDGEGIITLPAGSGEKWAILLPQDEVSEAEVQANDGTYTGTCATIPAIAENDYLTDGIAVTLETPAGPVGIIDGAFTINANGDQVYFSQGNLQYNKTTNEWSFMEHQYDIGYDIVETGYSLDVGENYANQNIISHFGWAASGYNHGSDYYQPWNTSMGNYCAYGIDGYNLYDQNGQADWGYNAISNGGNTENSGWRTLTHEEWEYLLNTRNTVSGWRYTYGSVNCINGLILLPDNWTTSIYELNFIDDSYYGSYFLLNIISADDWANTLEANGAVFLPGASSRHENILFCENNGGCYWSASYGYSINNWVLSYAFFLYENGQEFEPELGGYGFSVRLVRPVQ